MNTYYDDPIGPVRYRIDKRPVDRAEVSEMDGWRTAFNGITGLRLKVSDEAIEVLGFGPFLKLIETLGRAKLSLLPRDTTMWTVCLGRFSMNPGLSRWGPQADYVALSRTLPNDAEYTLAVLPSDRDLDRLRTALGMAGVRES